MPAYVSWKSPKRSAGASSLACVELGGDLHVAVGQGGGVEGAVGGGEVRASAVDDAVEAGRALGAGSRPLEGPAGLQVALASEDDDVLAEHVAAEGDGANLVVVAGGPAVLQDAVLADDAVTGHQRRGGEPGDRPGGGEELDGGQVAGEGQLSGAERSLPGQVAGSLRALSTEIDRLDQAAADRYGLNRTDMRALDILGRAGPLAPTALSWKHAFTT